MAYHVKSWDFLKTLKAEGKLEGVVAQMKIDILHPVWEDSSRKLIQEDIEKAEALLKS